MTASTIKALSAQLAAKEVSAEELARHYLSRIEAGAHLNAFTHVDAEATLAQARAADARIAAGNAAPLTGVPIAHKDVFVTRGWRATAGSKMLGNYVSPFDATVVERLGAAGMVTLGKTNMDEFAMGSSNENSAFGAVKNPWNLEHVPGGSSGGSAAAVAADLAPAATGTDTGDLADMYRKSRAEGFGWEVKRRILVGAYVLSHGYYDAYYLQAQKIRRIIAQDFQNVLAGANRQCDVIMGPVAPTVAWKLGEKTSDPVQMYLADIFTLSTSLAGLPGMSVPAGFGANGLPVGLQIIGNYFEEARMLQIAHAFQQATDWHHRQPAA